MRCRLESEEKDSTHELGSFSFEIPQVPCSFNTTLESGMISALHAHEKCKHLKVFPYKIFRMVDSFFYLNIADFVFYCGTNLVASFNNWW